MKRDPHREALTRLTRIAQKKEPGQRFLLQAVAGRVDRLAGVAFEVAVETGDPLGRLLAQRLEHEGDADLVGELAERIDQSDHVESVPLRELALVVVTRSLEIRRQIWREPSTTQRAAMAELCVTRGLRLQEAGRPEEGLEAIREGLAEFRRLAWKQPEKYLADVAEGFHSLAIVLGELLRQEEALRASRRSVVILRRLIPHHPEKLSAYARALDHLGIQLQVAGRERKALATFRDAVASARSVPIDMLRSYSLGARSRSTPCALLLPRLRLNLGLILWRLGHGEEAFETTQNAIDELRRHFDDRPHVVGIDLARGLTNLSLILSGLGRLEVSLEASREAVELRRQLVEERPEIFRPELAHSLVNLGMDLGGMNQLKDACEATREAVDLFRDIARNRPDERANLAGALGNLGMFQRGLGRSGVALPILREAKDLWSVLEREDPGRHRSGLAVAWNNLGAVELDLHRVEEALGAMEGARDLLQSPATEQPDVFEAHLARSFERVAIVSDELGHYAEAIAAARRAVICYRRLAAEQSEAFNVDLAVALTNLGVFLEEAGEPEAGLSAISEAIEIQRSSEGGERDPNLAGMLDRFGVRLALLDRLSPNCYAGDITLEIWRRRLPIM